MHRLLLLIAASVLLMTSVHAQNNAGEPGGLRSALGLGATTPATADFVTLAAINGMMEIQLGGLAIQKGVDAKTRAFAERMISDHSSALAELKGLVESNQVKAALPVALDSAREIQLGKLKLLDGADFAREYKAQQSSVHQEVASMFEQYAKRGEDPTLRMFAAKHLTQLQEHMKMAQELPQATAEQPPPR
jgi:putative membrane protein